MGTRIRELMGEEPGLVLGGALEVAGSKRLGERIGADVIVTADPSAALAGCDALIDFSVPASTLALLPHAERHGVRCVIGTTGFDAAGRDAITRLAKSVGVVFAPNFSVAVNVLTHLVREAAARLGPGFDAEIVELHHAAKRDAPSGTALRLAEAVAEGRGEAAARGGAGARDGFVLSRAGETGARIPGSIGLQALRGGDNPGEHTVMFIGSGERIELVHRAMTRDHFVRGALRAAAWVAGRAPGLHDMGDVLGL